MKTNRPCLKGTVVAAALGLLIGAAAWADTTPITDVTQVGATALVYKGPQVNVALSYRFAKLNPEGQWLLLDAVMTSSSGPTEVERASIAVRTPDGEVVPLATQVEFARAYPGLAATIARADVNREPMGYLLPRRYQPMRLFAERGVGLVFPSVWLDQWHDTFGRLFFRLPNGVHKGQYELLIILPKSEVVIPFTI
jgi:hypothetical protein